ncbi:glycosyltransferase [Flavobacterium sp.]|uniref:glycosyltransferase n=1 Tax=Flavobacterium sp. TaxID=239 RepID=UPI002634C6E7|nr:glycosyltransferase [Flavobacterium sp.]
MMKQKIYFICPDTKTPIGGIKQLYRQVDILNRNNFNAVILHKKRHFRHKWFENTTRLEYNLPLFLLIRQGLRTGKTSFLKSIFTKITLGIQRFIAPKLDENAIFVFPEIFSLGFLKIKKDIRKVIFNQNCYYSFLYNSIEKLPHEKQYTDQNILATITVSEDSKNYLSFAVPNTTVYRIRIGIDQSKFHYHPQKKKQIAFMPRKMKTEIVQILNILNYRNSLRDWSLVSIDNKTEQEVAQIMRESHIFLSFNYFEGFGLPPVEAMACGCIVIGFTGRAGKEYFNPDFSYPIPDGDIIGFVHKIEEVLALYEMTPTTFFEKQIKASQSILKEYSLENEKQDIITVWKRILNLRKSNTIQSGQHAVATTDSPSI